MRMNRLGNYFFPGACLAGDQDGSAAWRHLRNQIEHPLHPVALPDDIGKAVAFLERPLEFGVFAFQPALRDQVADLDQQLLVVPGLREIVVRSGLQSLDRNLHGTEGGDQNDRCFRVALAEVPQHFDTGTVGHHQVEQNQIVASFIETVETLGGIRRELNQIALHLKQRFETLADIRFVIDNQYAAFKGRGENFGVVRGIRHSLVFERKGTQDETVYQRRARFAPR